VSGVDATIVIPQHGHAELTRQCVASLRAVDPKPWPVIVIDDGSPAGEVDRLVDVAGPIQLIEQPRRGVSAAWNRGAADAETDWLIFLNNDTISHSAWVDRLLAPLREGSCAISGGRLREERGLPAAMGQRESGSEFLEGWVMALSTERFAELGGFDEAMRIYWSDTDLQLRAVEEWTEGNTSPLRAVDDLPLTHLGHRTAHDPRALRHRRRQWLADRRVFIEKWTRALSQTIEGR